MRLFLLCALALPACGPSPEARAPVIEEDRYVSAAGSFSVVFPAKPEESERKVETEVATFTLHQVGVAVTESNAMGAFTVTWADVPEAFEHRMVDTTRALVRKPPRVFVSEQESDVVPGIVKGWELQYEEGEIEKVARVFEVGRRYFQLLVEYPKGHRPPGMRRFFDTFRLR